MKVQVEFKGFGLSFINNLPRGLIYLRISDIDLEYQERAFLEPADQARGKDSQETETIIELKIGNFQIDNLINNEMPVVIGAKKYYDEYLQVANPQNIFSNMSSFYKIFKESDFKKKKGGGGKDDKTNQKHPFLIF